MKQMSKTILIDFFPYGRFRRAFKRAGLIAVTAWATVIWAGAAPAGETSVIVMLGDSLTAGYGLAAQDSWPAKLQADLKTRGHDIRVINAGVSGDTTSGGLARLEWALADPPSHVIVALGANDGLRAIDPKLTAGNLDRIIAGLKARGIIVLLAGMRAPPNLGRDYAREFDRIYPDLAAKHAVALYPFLLDGVAATAGLNQADGLHPNAAGVDIIVERLSPYVIRLLKKN